VSTIRNPAAFVGGVLVLLTGTALASDISVANQRSRHLDSEQAAIAACATAFVKELYPNGSPVVNTIAVPSRETNHDRPFGWTSVVELTTAVRSSGQPIAHS
jgi:hypothetical protein